MFISNYKNIPREFLYPPSISEATIIQKILAEHVRIEDEIHNNRPLFGGMDVSNNLFDPKQMIYAASVTLRHGSKEVEEQETISLRQTFPYISGFLGFREAPALVEAFSLLQEKPDIILVDGHGISHPRGLGIASHIGVLLDIPTIGVAKNILVGEPQGTPGSEIGDQVPLLWKNKQIGTVVRTKKRCNPLIISPGHRISLQTAVSLVLNNLDGYRLPAATRHAHLAANECRINNHNTPIC